MATFGGREAWKTRKQGDIGIAFHWITAGDFKDEPSMVLFPLRKRLGAAAFVIPMSKAFEYADSNGYPSSELVSSSFKAAEVMAMDSTRMTAHRIADVILNNIEDLVKMPPAPPVQRKHGPNVGEIALKSGGETIVETEIDLDQG